MVPINQKSLPERTADTLILMLHNENYSVGRKLPNEHALAKQLEVSRHTIRKAIHILVEKGVLEVERGSGTFVSGALGRSDDPLGLSMIYDKEVLITDLLEIRMMIEPRTAALAAQNASYQNIEHLQQLCHELERAIDEGENYLQKDMEFHQSIANCSKNTVLFNLIPFIHQMQVLHENISGERRKKETLKEHRRIVEAIAKRRCSDAQDAMLYHLMAVRQHLEKEKGNESS